MISRRGIRILLFAILCVSLSVLVHGWATAPTTASEETVSQIDPRDGITVVTESAKHGTLIAWHPNGSLLYYTNDHTKYFDVDPVRNESMTVEYAATDTIHTEGPTCSAPPCVRNIIERVNLSTGQVTEIYARYDHREHAGEWHDHERVNDTHILIADIVEDQVFMVDTETELIEWLWDAQSDFPVTGGGPYPKDWTHINDVELLADGRVLVSLRNQDQVVFLDRETGIERNWTLGADGDHETLFEQHNPDFIPKDRGGPALLVADSENGRVVEYQRVGTDWERSWQWRDDRLQWPRDADRLPNGNTLVADTHGKRILEVAPNGTVVWSAPLSHPYDVERLGTGPESATGESATRVNLESQTWNPASVENRDPLATAAGVVTVLFPDRIVNAVIYIAPVWMGRPQFFAAGASIVAVLVWGVVELRWRLPAIGLRWPLYLKQE